MAEAAVPSLHDLIKTIALNQMGSMQLCDVTFGRVTKASPLEITVDQKHILTSEFLVLTNAVKEHTVDITVSWQTVDDSYLKPAHTHVGNLGAPTAPPSDFDTKHHHDIKGRKKITVHNGLTLGEDVILLRVQGAQRYIVLDRVNMAQSTGESI